MQPSTLATLMPDQGNSPRHKIGRVHFAQGRQRDDCFTSRRSAATRATIWRTIREIEEAKAEVHLDYIASSQRRFDQRVASFLATMSKTFRPSKRAGPFASLSSAASRAPRCDRA